MERETIVPEGYEAQLEQWGLAPAVRVGATVYCSGQLGFGADGALPADPEAQLVNAFEHVAKVLRGAGARLADVVELDLVPCRNLRAARCVRKSAGSIPREATTRADGCGGCFARTSRSSRRTESHRRDWIRELQ